MATAAHGTMWPQTSRRCAPRIVRRSTPAARRMDSSSLSANLLIWLAAIATLAAGRSWRRVPGTGLVLAYVLNLWLIHWIAPALYILPWHRGFDPTVVEVGLRQSMYG